MPRQKKETSAAAEAFGGIEGITPEQVADPKFCQKLIAESLAKLATLPPLKVKQYQMAISEAHFQITGRRLSDYSSELQDPLVLLNDGSLLDRQETELAAIEKALDGIGLDGEKKKRWLRIIDRVRHAQAIARSCAAGVMVYVCRTQEKGEIFELAQVHRDFFAAWNDDNCPHSLVEAPPGHGKTTCLRAQILYDIGKNRELRCLILYDTVDKALKEVPVLKRLIDTQKYRALFPGTRVLSRRDSMENSKRRFTVERANRDSREPTIEGAGIASQINGSGYDRLYVDDPCNPAVVTQPGQREQIIDIWDNQTERRLRDPKNSRIRMICTPWHPDDLAGHIVSQVRAGQREGWKIAIDTFAVQDDADGNPISKWPQRYASRAYIHLRRILGQTKYNRLYKLQSNPEVVRKVRRVLYYPADIDRNTVEWRGMQPEHQEAIENRLAAIEAAEQWLSIDPSAVRGKNNSETSCSHIALTPDGRAYVREQYFFPGNPVEFQDWIVAAISQNVPVEKRESWNVPRKVDRVLIESQGGIAGQVALWRDYIMRKLKEYGMGWWGGIEDFKPRGMDSRANVGKERRLIDCAGYIEGGFIRFPGKMIYNSITKRMEYHCSDKPGISRVVNQILNFPVGTSDAVDTITQFLIHNWNRIRDVDSTAGNDRFKPRSEYAELKRKTVESAFRDSVKTPQDEENQWVIARFY